MSITPIEWTDETWNPVRGCSRVSEGCRNCYAERQAARNFPGLRSPTTGEAFAVLNGDGPHWTGKVELIESKLTEPLHWKKPRRVFVNSMSDLFYENLPDEAIDRVFALMALCPQHTFQVLTKRPERMREWTTDPLTPNRVRRQGVDILIERNIKVGFSWPLPNVWEGVSVEDQATADARIPLLLQTPAALRFVSYEPALAGLDFRRFLRCAHGFSGRCAQCEANARWNRAGGYPDLAAECRSGLDWVIVGGESGPQARPFDLEWARETIRQCKAAGVSVFVKQLGAHPVASKTNCLRTHYPLVDSKGGNWDEWPVDLRIREFPR